MEGHVPLDDPAAQQWAREAGARLITTLALGGLDAFRVARADVLADAGADGPMISRQRLSALVATLTTAVVVKAEIDRAAEEAR